MLTAITVVSKCPRHPIRTLLSLLPPRSRHLHLSQVAPYSQSNMPAAHWFSLSKTPFLARSSHCVSVTKSGALIVYGGELKPRTPIDTGVGCDTTPRGSLHVFDLSKGLLSQGWRMLTPDSKHAAADADTGPSLPEPRVGATTVWLNDALYLWGGRGGQDMTPLEAQQAGIWKATIRAAEGPQQSVRWERVAAVNEDQAPEPRSYHASVAHGVSCVFSSSFRCSSFVRVGVFQGCSGLRSHRITYTSTQAARPAGD